MYGAAEHETPAKGRSEEGRMENQKKQEGACSIGKGPPGHRVPRLWNPGVGGCNAIPLGPMGKRSRGHKTPWITTHSRRTRARRGVGKPRLTRWNLGLWVLFPKKVHRVWWSAQWKKFPRRPKGWGLCLFQRTGRPIISLTSPSGPSVVGAALPHSPLRMLGEEGGSWGHGPRRLQVCEEGWPMAAAPCPLVMCERQPSTRP